MEFPDVLDQLAADDAVRRVYGRPYQTADGATVISVAKVRWRGKRRSEDGAGYVTAAPVGVFVVHGKQARWAAAVDSNRIAMIGVMTGLLSAVIASLALLRRPPWPDLSVGSRHGR